MTLTLEAIYAKNLPLHGAKVRSYIGYNSTLKAKLKRGIYTKCAVCKEPLYHIKYGNKGAKIWCRITHMECMTINLRRKNNRP